MSVLAVRAVRRHPRASRIPLTDEIESERRSLLGLSYRLLGTVADAEDAVQETYARW